MAFHGRCSQKNQWHLPEISLKGNKELALQFSFPDQQQEKSMVIYDQSHLMSPIHLNINP